MEQILNYINGQLIPPVNKQYIDNVEPAKGEVYCQIPNSDNDDLQLAIDSAERAFPSWKNLSIGEKSDLLMKISNRITEQLEELAAAESKDSGKPLKLASSVDIPRAAENFKFFAHAITQFSSESHHNKNSINYTMRQPIGLVGCISPWNLPLYLFTWKIAPALACGNCVIAKPSELTPYTAFMLSKICQDILPPGVLNIVHGTGMNIGEPIVRSAKIKAISFTGGTETGKRIAELSAPLLRKVSLELGGKNPAIVFNDCDLPNTISKLVKASFTNQGEICLCASRVYIQKEIYDEFKEEFVKQVKALKVGDPKSNETDLGALISRAHLNKVGSYINSARELGGTLLCGDEELFINKTGYYMRPHVFEGLNNSCKVNQEEVFGPLVTLQSFKGEEEVIQLANDSIYGLASTIWTSDLNKAHRVGAQINTGIVWINTWMNRDLRTPFGGMNSSGLGREGGLEVLRFFTEPKNLCIQIN